jgi:CBS domain-containing protein
MSSVVTESVVAFLKTVPPFQFLPAADLEALSADMTLEYFPRGAIILRAGGHAAESLYIIQKGGVKLALSSRLGKELTLDMRSEGELFGILSLMGGDIARLDVVAVEDTICYCIPAPRIRQLMDDRQEVAGYFLRTSVTRYMDRSLHELRERTRLLGDSERLLYTVPVRDLAANQPVLCLQTATIREAARLAGDAGATCLFVVDSAGRALGIVTERDFTLAVAAGQAGDRPVAALMSAPVVSVDAGEPAFEALLLMLGKGIHHLLVTTGGLPQSVLTSHDLLLLQGKSPLHVARNLQEQKSVEGVARAWQRVRELIPLLLREGATASHITRLIAGFNDRLVSRILDLAAAELGPAPVPYCWVVLGSEGRSEQTFTTDQDNALIYADPPPGSSYAAETWFARLAAWAGDALARCGFPDCPGGYTAANPEWRRPLAAWRDRFHEWITGAQIRSVEDALIFFDMRPVYGDFTLFHALHAHNRDLLQSAVFFKSVLAYVSLEHKPPLGFFRQLVVERSGEHKDQLDIKLCGTGPIVNAARVFALDEGVPYTNTADRLKALQSFPQAAEAVEAFEYLTLLRLESQLRQARAGRTIGNHLDPASLSHLQRTLLKEAFQTAARLQSVLESRFRSAVWTQLQSR